MIIITGMLVAQIELPFSKGADSFIFSIDNINNPQGIVGRNERRIL